MIRLHVPPVQAFKIKMPYQQLGNRIGIVMVNDLASSALGLGSILTVVWSDKWKKYVYMNIQGCVSEPPIGSNQRQKKWYLLLLR